jgi:hypothetical protein
MGKGGAILGLIGILIGAGGFAMGFIAWSSMTTMQTELDSFENFNNALYTKNDGPYTVTPATTVLEIPNLNITFELSSNASAYLSFTCHAEITTSPVYSSVWFFFNVDGVDLSSPKNRVGNNQGGSTTDYFSVNLDHLIENMAVGSHNVSIKVSSESTANVLTYMTLYIQTFAP